MIFLPCRSRARALFRTSKAVSVPRRDMRSASWSSCCVALVIEGETRHYTPLRNALWDRDVGFSASRIMSLHVLPTHRLEAYPQPLHGSPTGEARGGQGTARPDNLK